MTTAELASLLRLPSQVRERSLSASWLSWLQWGGSAVSLLAVLVAAAVVLYAPPYKAGDAVGYNLGLGGGVLMLTLLLYPLRKRIRFLDRFGAMRSWFRLHMATGILGPLLVVFHSAFRIGSINARVALYATLIVSVSGVVGRFVYRHIHSGLYGRKLTLAEVEAEIQSCAADVDGILGQTPTIGIRLKEFHDEANAELPRFAARAWRFVTLRRRARAVAEAAWGDASVALDGQAFNERWSRDELAEHGHSVHRMIDRYVVAVCDAAQFTVWESLFSLWHVLHVPLVYLLVICGVVHVVAVHMY